jgi:hypothetical protein
VRFRRRDVLWRQAGDVLVALSPESDSPPVAIAGASTGVWLALDEVPGGSPTLDEVAALVAEASSPEVSAPREAVLAALTALEEHGLVERLP